MQTRTLQLGLKQRHHGKATDMAIPSIALDNMYQAGDCLEDTESIMYGALCAQRMMKAAVLRQKTKLIELQVKLTTDIRAGTILPCATQREQIRRSQQVNSYIEWLDLAGESIDNTIRIMRSPPQPPGRNMNNEQMATEGA